MDQLYQLEPKRSMNRPDRGLQTCLVRYVVSRGESVSRVQADSDWKSIEPRDDVRDLLEAAADRRSLAGGIFDQDGELAGSSGAAWSCRFAGSSVLSRRGITRG